MTAHPDTAVSPTRTHRRPRRRRRRDTNQLNQDTFLKLLVAQMKYQDPLSPTDSTQFLTQTAQFTQVSTLQQIMKDQQSMGHTNELLAASGMVGSGVTYSTIGIAPSTAVATTAVSVGGNLAQDAPVGAHSTVNVDGLQQRREADPARNCSSRAPTTGGRCRPRASGQSIGPRATSRSTRAVSARAPTSRSTRSDLDDLDGHDAARGRRPA